MPSASDAPVLAFGRPRLAFILARAWWALSKLSRALPRASLASLWSAAAEPQRAYGEDSNLWARIGGDRERELSAAVLAAASRLRVHAHLVPEPVLAPIDAHRAVDRWDIGADEALTASHPCLALAYLSRLEEMEHGGARGIAFGAALLARAVAGRGPLGDSPDPDVLRDFEASSSARARLPRVMEVALPLIARELEARALDRSANPSRAPSRPAARL